MLCRYGWGVRRLAPIALVAAACFTDAPPVDDGDESTGSTESTGTSTADDGGSTSSTASVDPTVDATTDGEVATGVGDTADSSGPSADTGSTGAAACVHRVFTTSEVFTPIQVNSFVNASLLCANEAEEAGLGGEWAAVLSDADGPAGAHLELCGDVFVANDGDDIVDDTLVATEDKWWTGDHSHGIDRHADGTMVPGATQYAWTGTNTNGTADGVDCEGWSSTNPRTYGSVGITNDIGQGLWSNEDPVACNQSHRLYCIEQFR